LFDQLAGHLNSCNSGTLASVEHLCQEQLRALESFGSQNRKNIEDLSTKAAIYVKSSILNLYHHHLPHVSDSDKGKRKDIGMITKFVNLVKIWLNRTSSSHIYNDRYIW
jgi:hypothetical protein